MTSSISKPLHVSAPYNASPTSDSNSPLAASGGFECAPLHTQAPKLSAESLSVPGITSQTSPPFQKTAADTDKPYTIFSPRERWGIVALVSTAGILSPLCSSIFFPAISAIAKDLDVSVEDVNLLLTVFLIMQGVSPTLWSGMCDSLGRRPTYIGTITLFVIACLGISFTDSYGILIFLRCLQATGSASVIAIGAGSISDIAPSKKRGGYMGAFQLGAMLGPGLGPVIGGVLSGTAGWHSIFYFLSALGGAVLVLIVFFLPETLRSIVGDGSLPTSGVNRPLIYHLKRLFLSSKPGKNPLDPLPRKSLKSIDYVAPLRLLLQKDVGLILLFAAWSYTAFYLVITSFTTQLAENYGLSDIKIGLCYIATGAGAACGSWATGKLLDRDWKILEEGLKTNGKPGETVACEKARMRSMPFVSVMYVAALIGYGWANDEHAPLAIPIILVFIVAFCATSQMTCIGTLSVDLFPTQAASVTASSNLCRCLLGAGGTAVVGPLINKIGVGWCMTAAAGITVASWGVLLAEWTWGGEWRRDREQLRESKKSSQ